MKVAGERPKIGISSCLLGENVRYDGTHQLDRFIRDTLGACLDFIPVCPEVEIGLTIPREAMRLVGDSKNPILLTSKTGVDHTDRMMKWADARLHELESEGLCGFIFKARSPSSGMRGVKVYTSDGMPRGTSSGIFARSFMNRLPLLPVEDDDRLHDPGLRENFIERIFVFRRWRSFVASSAGLRELVSFHTRHKYLIMSHSPSHLRLLGKLVASGNSMAWSRLLEEYLECLMGGMKLMATVKKNTNVLQHILGYFKKVLSADERQETLEVINEYHRGLVPLIVPIVLLRHFTRRCDEPYLSGQYYLYPHPTELMLRNHV